MSRSSEPFYRSAVNFLRHDAVNRGQERQLCGTATVCNMVSRPLIFFDQDCTAASPHDGICLGWRSPTRSLLHVNRFKVASPNTTAVLFRAFALPDRIARGLTPAAFELDRSGNSMLLSLGSVWTAVLLIVIRWGAGNGGSQRRDRYMYVHGCRMAPSNGERLAALHAASPLPQLV